MNRIATTSLIGAAAVVALVAVAGAPAFADGTSTPAPSAGKSLAAIQAKAKTATSERITALGTAIAKITAAPDISASDRSTILATLNGDVAGMLLFGTFLAWAVVDRIAVKRRGDLGAPAMPRFTRADGVALLAGSAAFVLMFWAHRYLIGVPVVLS